MKKQEAVSIGDIIKQAITTTGNQDEYERQRACYLWEEVVGPYINRMTTRRWIERDTLHVCLTSAVLKNELSFQSPRLVQLLNDALGRPLIANIAFH